MSPPFISVIMPIRNEADFIERSLGSVLSQDYPLERMEVLIADGMSDDDTVAIIKGMDNADRVRIIPNPERIQSYGLNRLIKEAKGEYIIRVDGHTILAPDYISRCVEALQDTGADNVGGPMTPKGITPFGMAIAAGGKSAFGVPTVFHVSDTAQYTDTVYLGAWPRNVFDQLGGFNTTVGVNEDYEFNYRLRASGGRIYFNPHIQSTYYSRQNPRDLFRQYYRYGRSRVRTLRQHPGSFRLRQAVAPLFVLGLIGGALMSLISPEVRVLWLTVLLLYGVLSLFFAVRAVRQNDASFWRVMQVFFMMHVAWGLGFWREVLFPGETL